MTVGDWILVGWAVGVANGAFWGWAFARSHYKKRTKT